MQKNRRQRLLVEFIKPALRSREAYTWALLAVILGLAAYLRIHNLATLPAPIHVDEAASAVYGLDIVNGKLPVLGFGFTNHLNTAFLVPGLVLKLFGVSVWNLRIIEAVFGVAAVLLTYLLGRSMFSWRVGLVAAALMAFNHFALAFSRLGLVNQQSMTLQLLAFWLLWEGMRRRSRTLTLLGGVFTGLGLYLYFASWIVPVILGLFVLWAVLFRRAEFFQSWRIGVWGVAGFGVLLLPWIAYILSDLAAFRQRPTEVFIFSNIGFWKEFWDTDSTLTVLRRQAGEIFETFTIGNDKSNQYGLDVPIFFPLSRAFFVLGLAIAAVRIRKPSHAFLLIWLLPTIVLGGVLTDYVTFMPRLVGMIPVAMLIAALGLVSFTNFVAWCIGRLGWTSRRLDWPRRRAVYAPALFLAVFALVTVNSALNHTRAYFTDYPVTPHTTWWPWIEPMSAIGRTLQSDETLSLAYVFTTKHVYTEHYILRFYTYGSGIELQNVPCDKTPCAIPAPLDNGTTAYILPIGRGYLEAQVMFREPNGEVFTVDGPVNSDGSIGQLFVAYVVTLGDAGAPGGQIGLAQPAPAR